MATTAAKRRHAWRLAGKRAAFAVVAGGGLGLAAQIALGWHPVDFVRTHFEQPFALAADQDRLSQLLHYTTERFSGPLAGFIIVLIALTATARWISDPLLTRIFPDPPPFVRYRLKKERERGLTPPEVQAVPKFVGRTQELSTLIKFANSRVRPFSWKAVIGVSGIGKTRLGIEWLASLAADGWDIGIVDRRAFDENQEIVPPHWRPRRKTALVFDEADRSWRDELGPTLAALARAARKRAPIRVVLLDQIEPAVTAGLEGYDYREREPVEKSGIAPLPLGAFGHDEIAQFWRNLRDNENPPDEIAEDTGGRPRALLVRAAFPGINYQEALGVWAENLIPALRGGRDAENAPKELIKYLALSALASPAQIGGNATVSDFVGDVSGVSLSRFFPLDIEFTEFLPAFAPEDLGREILLRSLPFMNPAERKALVRAALFANLEMTEASLGALWAERPESQDAVNHYHGLAMLGSKPSQERAKCLVQLQRTFDELQPETAVKARTNAAKLVDVIAEAKASNLNVPLNELVDLAERRPFDPAIRLEEAKGAVNAMSAYSNDPPQPKELERWGARLIAIAETPAFLRDPGIRLQEASGAVNAMRAYCHNPAQPKELERWGARLIAIAEMPEFLRDPAIRLEEAKGAVNAMSAYSNDPPQPKELERWGARLIAIAETPAFLRDPGIRLQEASGAVNAMRAYCHNPAQPKELERWGARLIAIAETPAFLRDPGIRLQEASGAVNAMSAYSNDPPQPKELERWGARLFAIAETPALFHDPADIRLQEAKGAVNAMRAYCHNPPQPKELERWGDRLIAIAEIPEFYRDPAIRLREAMGAVNAMSAYNDPPQPKELERWGNRLIAIAETPALFHDPADIRLQEAKGAVNALNGYSKMGSAGHPQQRRWIMRLGRCTRDFPANVEIQEQGRRYGVAYAEQMNKNWPYGPPAWLK